MNIKLHLCGSCPAREKIGVTGRHINCCLESKKVKKRSTDFCLQHPMNQLEIEKEKARMNYKAKINSWKDNKE